jgi:hypothetical protein
MFQMEYAQSLEKSKKKSSHQSMAAGFTLRGKDRARSQLPIKVARLALLEEEPRNFREAYQKLLVEKKLKAAE